MKQRSPEIDENAIVCCAEEKVAFYSLHLVICYCQQLTVGGLLLFRKVIVHVLADDSVAALLMIVSTFSVAPGYIFFRYLVAFLLTNNTATVSMKY